MLLVEIHSQIVRNLTTRRDDDTVGLLHIDDVHHTLEGQLVEVQTVAHIVVRRHRLRVIVDHHRAPALLADGVQRLHATPVELHAGANAIGTRAQHDNTASVVLIGNVIVRRSTIATNGA